MNLNTLWIYQVALPAGKYAGFVRASAKLCSESSGTPRAQDERWRSESQAGWRSGGKGESKTFYSLTREA